MWEGGREGEGEGEERERGMGRRGGGSKMMEFEC